MIEKLFETSCFFPLKKGIYFIYDDDKNNNPLFVNENEKWNLNLINNSQSKVNFFQNDGCLMTNNQLKRCDWICYKENEFYFIEAKDVKPKSRRSERNDAVEKFNLTIPYFTNLYPVINKMKLIVVMNFRSSKITNAANKSKEVYFQEVHNAEYRETNILEFI